MGFYLYPGLFLPIIILGGKDMFKNKQMLIGIISTIAIVIVAIGAYFGYQAYINSHTQVGSKEITVVVVYDNNLSTYKFKTDAEFLGTALDEQNLITVQTSTYGRYITGADGREANNDNKEWWQVFLNSQPTQVGVDDQAIKNNDIIFLVLMTGYDS